MYKLVVVTNAYFPGMTTSDGWLFLSSFIVTYNFTAMQTAFTNVGLTAGFYGGIAFVG
jgi:hypothetical protein